MLLPTLLTLLTVFSAEVGTEPKPSLDLYFHADLNGQLATPACGRAKASVPDYAALLAALRRTRDTPTAAGAPRPSLTLLGPNIIAPDLFTRAILQQSPSQRDSTSTEAMLAALFRSGGYQAFTVGSRDLSAEPDQLATFVHAMIEAGIPLVSSNVTCRPDAPDARSRLCRALRSRVLIEVAGAGKLGVVATLSPRLVSRVEPSHRRGVDLEDPRAAIVRETAALRREGATRVVVMTEVAADRDGLDELRTLQAALARTATPPDAILSAGLADDEGGRPVRLIRQDGAPVVAGSTAGSRGVTHLALSAAGLPAEVSAVDADPNVRDVSAADILAPWVAAFCSRFGQPLGPRIKGILTRDDFVRYALEVMRRAAGAEIAVLNDRFVKAAPFPLAGAFTAGELAQALPYRAVLGVAHVTGAQLGSIIGPSLAHPKLRAVGIANDGGLKVNGRAVDNARRYRVATIAFVADGGDGILAPGALPWRSLSNQPSVSDLMEDFLLHHAGDEDGDPTIDPSSDFGSPPSDRLLLVGLTDVGLDLSDSSIGNGPGYTDAQLTRAQQRSFKLDWSSLLQARAPDAEVDGRFRLQYGWTRTHPTGQPAVSAESIDLITGSVTYNDRRLRRALSKHPAAAFPDPYARATLESELTRPAVTPTQMRTYHHAEVTATAGALFAPVPKLRLRAGPGVRKELVADGGPGRWRPLVEAGLTLDQVVIATGTLPVRFDATADYVIVDPAGGREQQLRASAHMSVPILPLLLFNVGVDAYAAQRADTPWGWSADTTAGLRVHFDEAHQRL